MQWAVSDGLLWCGPGCQRTRFIWVGSLQKNLNVIVLLRIFKMNKKLISFLVIIVFSFCTEAFAADKQKDSITDLTPWIGESVSVIKLYESDAGDKFFSEVVKYAPKGYTKKMVKDFIYDMFSLKFKSFRVVDENTINIDNKITGDYVYVCSVSTRWKEHNTTWEVFKTDSKEMIAAGFKYFLLFQFHQHSKDSLRHCHLRYGNENFDFLVTDPSVQLWWPTVYQPKNTDETKIMAQMTKKAKLQATMLPPLKKVIKE
jgi:hypothetical protein